MYQVTESIKNTQDLEFFLLNNQAEINSEICQNILAMIYTAHVDKVYLQEISHAILNFSSKITIAGATTTGEIDNGRTITESTTVTLIFFESTKVLPITLKIENGNEKEVAQTLIGKLNRIRPKGVILLTSPLNRDANIIVRELIESSFDFEIFGGGSGDYKHEYSLLLSGDQVFESGLIAICFDGASLQIEKHTFVGWSPMSKEMTITKADFNKVITIDNKPAFDIYKKYLNIKNDSNFFAEAIGFPLLIKSNNDYLARVPINVTSDGGLEFICDFKGQEKFRLGFMNPQLIDKRFEDVKTSLTAFSPEAIFLFTCGCRRFALYDDIQFETQYLADIAPISGFYTIGELCNIQSQILHMNLAFIAVGMRENSISKKHGRTLDKSESIEPDKFKTSHKVVIGRLLNFIKVLNAELEEKTITDGLTNLFNRRHFDNVFSSAIKTAKRHNELLCFLMIDIDYFKQYNDYYGHQAGDQALIKVAKCIQSNAKRADDFCFRLGGEEFGVVFKPKSKDQAVRFAQGLIDSVEQLRIEHDKSEVSSYLTVSVGVACRVVNSSISEDSFYKVADGLLYEAKKEGRNRASFDAG